MIINFIWVNIFLVKLPLTVAGNCGVAFGATKLSPLTKVSWKEILSKTKNQHHNCLLLGAAIPEYLLSIVYIVNSF
jgi:hypothetical protein